MAARRKSTRHNEVEVDRVPEVATFNEVRDRYRAFREKNPEFFQYLDHIQEEYNQALDAADKAVRSRNVSCGDFELYQYRTTYNGQALLDAVGPQKFADIGGVVVTTITHKVDGTRFDLAVAAGHIPQNVVDQVVTRSPSYHKPPKLEVV